MKPSLVVMDAAQVRAALSFKDCIPLMRRAMQALSAGEVAQHLRSFLPVGDAGTFAIMPAVTPEGFGAKLVSVSTDDQGRRRHQGLVVLFDAGTGAPVFVGDAEEITRIRTAAASAAATDALARADAEVMTILGTGVQAQAHLCALSTVRPIRHIRIWGRNKDKAVALAAIANLSHDITVTAHDTVAEACAGSDIITTVTASREAFLAAEHADAGCHINLVGSSGPATTEAATDLVAKAVYIGDHRDHVLAHGGEFVRAREAGLIDNTHFVAEIGEVFGGLHPGRTSADQVTIYKSLGHATQDLAAAVWLLRRHLRGQ